MMLLRCTAKVLKMLEQQPRKVKFSQSQTSPQEWYVNFVDGFGPTFALCVNPLSLYTLVLFADHLDGVGDLAGRLLSRLTLHMVELGIDRPRVKRLAQECSSVLVAKTARYGLITLATRQTFAIWNISSIVASRFRRTSRRASRATSSPTLLRHLKQSATVLAGL